MIRKIVIQNFQRIDEPLEIGVGPVTLLVGENGCGKSSFMKGVHWAVRCATLAQGGRVTLDQMDYVPSRDFLDLAHKTKLQNSQAGRKVSVSFYDENDSETSIQISAARNNAGVNVAVSGSLRDILTNNEKPSTAYIPGIAGTAEEETILATPIMHRKAASGEGGSVLRQIILSNAVGVEGTGSAYQELAELSRWVSYILPETKFWVKFDRLRDKNIDVKFLTPEMKVPGQGYNVSWKSIEMAGTGFLQVVQIFAYLLYFKPKLILVDEPDAHLHPGRQQKLIRALELASKEFPETQIILTTHSPSLVRALSSEALIHWIDDGKVRANGDAVRARMGWSALDKELLIFTEDGNTDYLQALLSQWPTLNEKCAIWPTYGKESLPNGQKCRALSEKMKLKVMVHRDRDFMSDVDVSEWVALKGYSSNAITFWIPEGSDIESIFCSKDYIADVLDVPLNIAEEIIEAALQKFDEAGCMQVFSGAYSDCVNRLPNTAERNPIARWGALGEFGISTIKGKSLLDMIKKACVDVLPRHGLARKIGNRNNIGYVFRNIKLADDLRSTIQGLLAT